MSGLGQTSLGGGGLGAGRSGLGLGGGLSLGGGLGQNQQPASLAGAGGMNFGGGLGLQSGTGTVQGLTNPSGSSPGAGLGLSLGRMGQTPAASGLGLSVTANASGQIPSLGGLGQTAVLGSGLGLGVQNGGLLGGRGSQPSAHGQTTLPGGLGLGLGQTSLGNGLGQTSLAGGLGKGLGQTSLAGGLGQTSLAGGLGQTSLAGGLGQTSLAGGLGQTSLAGGLGQTSLAGGLGQTSLAGGLGQTSVAGGLGKGLGQTSVASGLGQTSLAGGLGQTSLAGGLGQTSLASGLGKGLGQTSVASGLGQTSGTKSSDSGLLMDQELPPELNDLVVKFVDHMKRQKECQKQVMHFNHKSMKKTAEELAGHRLSLTRVQQAINRERQSTASLRADIHRTLTFAELAQQTSDTPASLQYENTAPMRYFSCVADDFESKMTHFQRQISELETHLCSMPRHDTMDPNLIVEVLQTQHRAFLTLAAQLHVLHQRVQDRCTDYLRYRQLRFNDSTDVFSKRQGHRKRSASPGEVKKGPAPFSMPLPLPPNPGYGPSGPHPLGPHPLVAQPALGQRTTMFNSPGQRTGLQSMGGQLGVGLSGLTTGFSTGAANPRLGTPFPGPVALGNQSAINPPPPAVGLNQSKPLMATTGQNFQLMPPPVAKKKSFF